MCSFPQCSSVRRDTFSPTHPKLRLSSGPARAFLNVSLPFRTLASGALGVCLSLFFALSWFSLYPRSYALLPPLSPAPRLRARSDKPYVHYCSLLHPVHSRVVCLVTHTPGYVRGTKPCACCSHRHLCLCSSLHSSYPTVLEHTNAAREQTHTHRVYTEYPQTAQTVQRVHRLASSLPHSACSHPAPAFPLGLPGWLVVQTRGLTTNIPLPLQYAFLVLHQNPRRPSLVARAPSSSMYPALNAGLGRGYGVCVS